MSVCQLLTVKELNGLKVTNEKISGISLYGVTFLTDRYLIICLNKLPLNSFINKTIPTGKRKNVSIRASLFSLSLSPS